MEKGKFFGKVMDTVFGPRIKGTVLAVHEDQDGAKKVIIDRGTDSVAVEQVKSLRFGPLKYTSLPQPTTDFKPGDIFDARTNDSKPWLEGTRV